MKLAIVFIVIVTVVQRGVSRSTGNIRSNGKTFVKQSYKNTIDADTLFATVDVDGNKYLSFEEAIIYLSKHLGLDECTIRVEFKKMDLNGDGQITRHELDQITSMDADTLYEDLQNITDTAYADAIFSMIDFDGNKYLSLEEIINFLSKHFGTPLDERFIRAEFKKMDLDGDGQISRYELDHQILQLNN